MAIKNRTELKAYFVKNAIPTEANFADLIDSQVNQVAEAVIKPAADPFTLVAAPGDQKRVLRLYGNWPTANPDWMFALNPTDGTATKAGFGVTDGTGIVRLFVEAGTGRVGVGTNAPQAGLDVTTTAQVRQNLNVQGAIVPSVGNAENRGIQFPGDPGGGSLDRAFIRYFVENPTGTTPEQTKLLIGNNNDADDRISLYQMSGERLTVYNGRVGINNTSPVASLDVAPVSGTWGGWQEAIRLSHPSHAAITYPTSGLLFGLHSDRNFYFADTTNGVYTAVISPTNGGRLGVATNGNPGYGLHVKTNTTDWQARFENPSSNSNVYLAHGGGFGMHVRTDTASTTNYLFELYNGAQGGSKFYVTTDGRVGIGTNAPDASLHVTNGSRFLGGRHYFKDSENVGRLRVGAAWSVPGIYSEDAQDIVVGCSGGKRVHLGQVNAASILDGRMEASAGVKANEIGLGTQFHGTTTWPYETIQMNPGHNLRIWYGTTERFVFGSSGIVEANAWRGRAANWNDIGADGTVMTDNVSYKAMMIVGSDQGQGNARWIRMWDNVTVHGTLRANTKLFHIDHPVDAKKSLVHSVLEGPESAVFYRGEAALVRGECVIELPSYFEALTRKEDRTVLVTPKLTEKGETSAVAAGAVVDGKVVVRGIDQRNPNQRFYWEVKGVRADIEALEVEPAKDEAPTPTSAPAPTTKPAGA